MGILLLIPLILFALIIVGVVKKNKRLWIISLIGCIIFTMIIIVLTTLNTDSGISIHLGMLN